MTPLPQVPGGAGAGFGRIAGRLVPWIGLALIAYDLWQLWQWYMANSTHTGYTPQSCCANQTDPTSAGTEYRWGPLYGVNNLLSTCANGCFFAGIPATESPVPVGPYRSYWIGWIRTKPSPGKVKGTNYMRAVGNGAPAFTVLPRVGDLPLPALDPLPWVAPVIDPFSAPIQQPAGPLVPLPWRLLPFRGPNPLRSPVEQTQRGNAVPARAPDPFEEPVIAPRVAPDPFEWVAPVTVPPLSPAVVGQAGPSFQIDPAGRVAISPPPAAPPLPRPPEPKTVEVKEVVRGARRVWRLTNAGTEARDFVRELWKGLDPKWRAKENPQLLRIPGWKPLPRGPRTAIPTPQKMAEDIYKGVKEGKMNWNEALNNLIENQISDYVFGRFGRKLGEASRKQRRLIGYGAGDVH